MKFTPIDCDLNGYLDFRPDGVHSVSLHDYEEVEVINNAQVRILRCRKCGAYSVGWSRQPINYEVEDAEENI